MKRSSSVELEHEAKRRRIDATEDLSTKSLEGDAQVMDTADPVSTIRPDLNAGDAMEIINAGTTIQDLPPEILGNHIFKFFDFTYWLKSFVTVSKYWQLAAVQSTVDKQLRIRKIVGTAWCTISRYRVSTLIFKRHVHLSEVATLINASPRIRSVKFNCAPVAYEFLPATKFSFNNVSSHL